jgi:hypothetical protein
VDYVKSLRYETDENIVTGIRNVFSTIMNSPNGDVVKKHLTADHEHNKTVFVRAVGKFLDGLKRQGEIDEITADRLQKITENRAGEIWPSLAQPSASSDSPQAESPES